MAVLRANYLVENPTPFVVIHTPDYSEVWLVASLRPDNDVAYGLYYKDRSPGGLPMPGLGHFSLDDIAESFGCDLTVRWFCPEATIDTYMWIAARYNEIFWPLGSKLRNHKMWDKKYKKEHNGESLYKLDNK